MDPEELSRIHAFSRQDNYLIICVEGFDSWIRRNSPASGQDNYLIICGEGFDSWIRRNSPASTRFLGRILSYFMCGRFRPVDPEELSRIHAFSGQDYYLSICG